MRYVQTLIMSLAFFLAMTQRLMADELLIFSANWCGPCQALKADLKKDPSIVAGYEWGFIDVGTEKELTQRYKVTTVPTLIVLDKDNNEVKRQMGYMGPEKLKKWLNDTKPSTYGVRYDSKTAHYVGGVILGRRFRAGWHD